MVYCIRCGTLNSDSDTNCSNCGAPLVTERTQNAPYTRYEYRRYNDRYRHHGGGGLGLLIVGVFIVIIGIAALVGFTTFWSYFWPIVLILIGLWVLILGLRRNRRFRQASSP